MPAEFDQLSENEGPYVTAALICEKVLQDADGTLSAIRIIDQLKIEPVRSEQPEGRTMVPTLALYLLLALKGGRIGATHEIKVVGHGPSGTEQLIQTQSASFGSTEQGGVPGVQLVVNLQLPHPQPGTYWFEALLDERRISAIPLRVVWAGSPSWAELMPGAS